jgi:hypothetical protein
MRSHSVDDDPTFGLRNVLTRDVVPARNGIDPSDGAQEDGLLLFRGEIAAG